MNRVKNQFCKAESGNERSRQKKAENGKRSFLLIRGLFLTPCSAVIINIP